MSKINILYFMPDCPIHRNAGNKTHTLQMLEYFNSRHQYFNLDYVGEQRWGQWKEEDKQEFNRIFPNLNLHVFDRKMDKKNKLRYFFKYKLPNAYKKNKWLLQKPVLANHNTVQLQTAFNQLLQQNKYQYIIINYVTWASLIENNQYLNGAILVNDTHDFITAQQKLDKRFKLGKSFEREIRLLSLFNEIWTLSYDERYLFSQFLPGTHRFIPIMFSPRYRTQAKTKDKKYDLIFVGSENKNNVRSLNWFFEEVYPLLPKNLRICIVGKICDHIPVFENVEKHSFAEDLSTFYCNTRVSICPMLSGTGIKVKVVEAISFGLPVVCNLRGLDGLPVKERNGCLRGDTPMEFASHITNILNNDFLYKKVQQEAIELFSAYFEKDKCHNYLDNLFQVDNIPVTVPALGEVYQMTKNAPKRKLSLVTSR